MAEQFPKYKSRLTALGKKLHSPSFEPDPLFDVKTHVSSTTLPHPAGKKELESLVRIKAWSEIGWSYPRVFI